MSEKPSTSVGNQSGERSNFRERRIYGLGGTSFIVAGVLVALTLPLIPLIIPSLAPTSAEAGLVALRSQGLIYGATWVLYLVSDVLYLVAFFALYYALRKTSKGLAKAAVVLNAVFVAVDVAIDIPLRLWLIQLSQSYALAGSGTQPQIVSTATFDISTSNLVALVATFFQFVALILASYLMMKDSRFGKRPAYLGLATGIVALVFIPAFIASSQVAGIFNLAGFALLAVWSVLVGIKLHKLSKIEF